MVTRLEPTSAGTPQSAVGRLRISVCDCREDETCATFSDDEGFDTSS